MRSSYASPNIVRMIKLNLMRRTGHVTYMERSVYIVMVGETKGRILLEKSERRCENRIEMDLKETRWIGVGLSGSE